MKAATAISGKFEHGIARADLSWQPHRPDLTAEVRADVTVHDRQMVVVQQFKLKAADGFARPVRFRTPTGATGLKSQPPLDPVGPGEWSLTPPADAMSCGCAVASPAGEASGATRIVHADAGIGGVARVQATGHAKAAKAARNK